MHLLYAYRITGRLVTIAQFRDMHEALPLGEDSMKELPYMIYKSRMMTQDRIN